MARKLDELKMLEAAYLRSQGKDQNAIAERLKISQSKVSHYISDAREHGILEFRFVDDRVPPEQLARVKAKLRSEPLEQMLARIGPSRPGLRTPALHVYPCRSRITSDMAWKHRIERFAGDCAEDLLKVLDSASVIGVAWGVMIANAVDAMRTSRRTNLRSKQTVIPLLGEPLGRPITQHSSSVLASNLAEILDPDCTPGKTLSLGPVPAFIPADMTRAETKAIHKLIRRMTAYREIYGAEESAVDGEEKSVPWIERVDAILTSVSNQERPLGFDDDGLIRATGIRRQRLNDLVIGDLCGVVIPRPNLDRQSRAEIDSIMSQWTGVRVEHLEKCAARARNGDPDGAPGVIVLAIGANKAPVVHEALRRGLIQHLFMDEDLADRLGEICVQKSRDA